MPVYEYLCPDGHRFTEFFNTMRIAEMHTKEYPCGCGKTGERTFDRQMFSAPGDDRQKRIKKVDDRKKRQAKRVDAMVSDGKLTNDQAWAMSEIGKRGNSPYQTDPKEHKSEVPEGPKDVDYVAE